MDAGDRRPCQARLHGYGHSADQHQAAELTHSDRLGFRTSGVAARLLVDLLEALDQPVDALVVR